jgi:hypothetical protein
LNIIFTLFKRLVLNSLHNCGTELVVNASTNKGLEVLMGGKKGCFE